MPRRTPLDPWSSTRRHRPPHALDRGKALFITAATFQRVPHLGSAGRKDDFTRLVEGSCEQFRLDLLAWVVLDEHYHLIVTPEEPGQVADWLYALHTESGRRWNQQDEAPGRQCWYQYWDTSLWTDGDVWSRINYIHRNPVKHGYVEDPALWRWSSLHSFEAHWEDEACRANRDRFPAPLKVRYDDF